MLWECTCRSFMTFTDLRVLWFVALNQNIYLAQGSGKHGHVSFTKLLSLHKYCQSELSESSGTIGVVRIVSNSLWTHYRSMFWGRRYWDFLPSFFSPLSWRPVDCLWRSGKLPPLSKNWETRGAVVPNLPYLPALTSNFCVAPSAEICPQVCPHRQLLHRLPSQEISPASFRLLIIIHWQVLMVLRREDTLLPLLSISGLWSNLHRNCTSEAKETQLPQSTESKIFDFHNTPNICKIQAISWLLYFPI